MEQTDDSRVEETKIQRLLKNNKVKDKVTGKEALRLSPHFLFRDFASGVLKRSKKDEIYEDSEARIRNSQYSRQKR